MDILEVKNLKTSFFTHFGEVEAVRGLSFKLKKGESLGIVGESGSGKSVTAQSIMKLINSPGKIKDGEIIFKNRDILKLKNKEIQKIRGNDISMIFQDPMTSLNPLFTIGDQIIEVLMLHQNLNKKEAKQRAIEMLKLVGIPSPEERIKNYPFEFSGGMRQRAMIAMAISCSPDLIIADEPTTALDVTIQAQIMDLLKKLQEDLDTSIIMITHDLGIVADVCKNIIVMYGGLIIEYGSAEDIFYNSKHPYTKGLLESIPKLEKMDEKLIPIKGSPPDLFNPPKGCPFSSRCKYTMQICVDKLPNEFNIKDDHYSRCWLLHEEAPKVDFI